MSPTISTFAHPSISVGVELGWRKPKSQSLLTPSFQRFVRRGGLFTEKRISPIFWLNTKPGEPFLLTSTFPFAGDTRFFPKPLIDLNFDAADDLKKLKRVRFVSDRRFRQIVNGGSIVFDSDDLINDGQLWIHDDDKCLHTVWKTDKRPRVTLDRQSSTSEIWHLKAVKFEENCGLWFDAKFEAEEIQTQIETILRVLGDTGIGGERNAGYGTFDLHSELGAPESDQEVDRFVTLAPICPRDTDELNGLIQGDVGYALEERSGWIGSSEGSGLRRQQVWMFAEGSVLNGNGVQVGRLVDLKPEACPHPVWRYAYAWPIKI